VPVALTDAARATGTTVVLIIHAPRTAAYADRELIVRDGQITFGGPNGLGPPHLVSRKHTADLPAAPNWLLRPGRDGTDRCPSSRSRVLVAGRERSGHPKGSCS